MLLVWRDVDLLCCCIVRMLCCGGVGWLVWCCVFLCFVVLTWCVVVLCVLFVVV